ncbi:hypothetical protein J8I26_04340 [Herbaspirillum sp. LeCh32-8]|uniref:hypothetical protein n=1 Tax=Herbaspirillum sp. LeCh32-8 TaxID=2821356 RepID=UPI001AE9EC9C|nr:hypothetical protein [Herbaspirillum sp. LeCh32-8]MBP0597320.1 hypothetical protein [Herbaspirillum sp. LeCh32-8]
MRKKRQHDGMPAELVAALGLVWGHLNAYQYEEAYALASGCLLLWPDDEKLSLMRDFAATEVLEPVDRQRLYAMRTPQNAAWVDLVLRRLQYACDNKA